MPEDSLVPASLAYRKNQVAIWNGKPPEKYTRIVPHVRGNFVVELGAAEGVLALMLAEAGKRVTAVERRTERHEEAKALQARWKKLGRKVDSCRMVHSDIAETPFFYGADCVVAVRVIYHLRDNAKKVLAAAAAARVANILLCGNKNRAASFEAGNPEGSLGWFNYYSTIKGMSELLTGAGYKIEQVIAEGDPIVIGTYSPRSSQ